MNYSKRNHSPLVYACLFVVINIFIWFYFDLGSLLTLETLKCHSIALQNFVAHHYTSSVLLYLLVYILDAALFLPATALLIMVGGFLFGVPAATCYVVFAATCGATCAFLVTRYLLGSVMQARYAHRLKDFNERIASNYIRYLLFVRLVPIFPFFLTNILAGLTLVPLRTFIWTTALGIIPNVILYAFLGEQLTCLTRLSDIVTVKFVGALLILCVLSSAPLIIKKK